LGAQILAAESRVFELKHRSAEEVVPLLWPIAGKENIAGQGRYITVKGSARTIESVKEALTRLDIAPRLYQVTLKQERSVFADKPGSITYGTPGVQDESLTQTIQILEGHAGYMALQKTIPYADWVSLFGQWDSGLSASIAQETAVNGFFIKIEHRNSHALVEIRTRLEGLDFNFASRDRLEQEYLRARFDLAANEGFDDAVVTPDNKKKALDALVKSLLRSLQEG